MAIGKDILESDEFKAAVKEAVDSEVKGLKAKNGELIEANKKLKTDVAERDERITELEGEVEKKAGGKEEIENLKKQLETKHGKDRQKLQEQLDAANKQVRTLLVDNGLTEALTKKGVKGPYLDAAKALIQQKNKIEVVDADGVPKAQIDGADLDAFVDKWSASDHGKHFITAPENSGGGSQGANGKGQAQNVKTIKRSEFNALPPDGQMKHVNEGGAVVD